MLLDPGTVVALPGSDGLEVQGTDGDPEPGRVEIVVQREADVRRSELGEHELAQARTVDEAARDRGCAAIRLQMTDAVRLPPLGLVWTVMRNLAVTVTFLSITLGGVAISSASCRIHNDTAFEFKVESGNTSNQSVGAHTTTSIASGKIIGKDDKSGKTISGSCKDGDSVEVTDDHGTPVLSVK